MLKRIAYRLTVINALVFLLVLSVSAASVYIFSANRIDAENREILEQVLKPLEYDAQWTNDFIPTAKDNFQGWNCADMKNDSSGWDYADLLPNLAQTIQFFDPKGQLLAEKGAMKIQLPLDKKATFQEQKNVHSLVLTRALGGENKKIGFVRVAMPLSNSDELKRKTIIDLITGTLVAGAVSAFAILWLVRQGLKPVEASMQQLTDFSADASHELQGPLMAIKTNGSVALKYQTGMRESDKEKMTAILNAADQMTATIDALLRLADLEQPLPIAELKLIRATELASELHSEMASLLAKKCVELVVHVDDPRLSFTAIEADAKAVLQNVLRNAIIYSHDGGHVNFEAKKIGKYVQFKIEDFGIGIKASDLPRIFDRFWRSDKARSYRSGGNGLGLAIAKNIVDRYQGSIIVESVYEKGTCVDVRFPELPHIT